MSTPVEYRNVVANIDDVALTDQPVLAAAKHLLPDDFDGLHLFHNLYHHNVMDEGRPGDEVLGEARDLLLAKHQQQLESLASGFGLTADCHVGWSDPAWLALLRFSQDRAVDLVIAQTRAQTRWQRLILSNEDWQLVRHCAVPLWLVRTDAAKSYRRIVAAIDPMHADDKPADLDQRILALAASFARSFGASLHVINVVPPILPVTPGVAETVLVTDTRSQEAIRQAHVAKATRLVAAVDCDIAEVRVVVGRPADVLIEHVKSVNADLLVLGAIARKALTKLLVGSTAERVLDAIPCDVLIAKPASFDPQLPERG